MLHVFPVSTKRSRTSEARRGAALYIILLVVVLYAALAVGVVRNTGMSAGSLTTEKNTISIAEIQSALNAYMSEFNRLTLQGCSPGEIYPFAYSPSELSAIGYSTALRNPRCVLYNTMGGNMPFYAPRTDIIDFYANNAWGGMDEGTVRILLHINYQPMLVNFPGIATSAVDAVLLYILGPPPSVPGEEKTTRLCNQINHSAGIDYTITEANLSAFANWNARYLYDTTSSIDPLSASLPALGLPPAFHGKPYGCLYQFGVLQIYKIILER